MWPPPVRADQINKYGLPFKSMNNFVMGASYSSHTRIKSNQIKQNRIIPYGLELHSNQKFHEFLQTILMVELLAFLNDFNFDRLITNYTNLRKSGVRYFAVG